MKITVFIDIKLIPKKINSANLSTYIPLVGYCYAVLSTTMFSITSMSMLVRR